MPKKFLSTPSARRATKHAKRGNSFKRFLSTPSARRATTAGYTLYKKHEKISIHALREEGDTSGRRSAACSRNFYPRPPRGGRPRLALCAALRALFLSTPSARRATVDPGKMFCEACKFLSTPSARRATIKPFVKVGKLKFLSTPSARRATKNLAVRHLLLDDFYPRPPRGGRH